MITPRLRYALTTIGYSLFFRGARGDALRIAAVALLMAMADAPVVRAQDPSAQATQDAQQPAAAIASTLPPGESHLPHREERAIANARELEEAKRAAQFREGGPSVAAPVFSLKPGAYTGSQTVEITTETPSSIIYFTFDDATPVESWLRYTGPITLVNTSTLHAVAWAPMHSASRVSTAAYTLRSPAPH